MKGLEARSERLAVVSPWGASLIASGGRGEARQCSSLTGGTLTSYSQNMLCGMADQGLV